MSPGSRTLGQIQNTTVSNRVGTGGGAADAIAGVLDGPRTVDRKRYLKHRRRRRFRCGRRSSSLLFATAKSDEGQHKQRQSLGTHSYSRLAKLS